MASPAKGCLETPHERPDHPKPEPATAAQLLQQGLFHHRRGELSLAMDRYTDVLRNDPKNADALYYVAVVACQEGQYKQGAELARRAIAIGPPQARVHNLLGQAHDRLGEPLEAIKNYDKAIALDPNFAEAHGNRAGILVDAGLARRGAEKLRPRARAQAGLGAGLDQPRRPAAGARPPRGGAGELRQGALASRPTTAPS